MALENDEGEAAAASPIGLGWRLLGRLTLVGITWLISVLVVLTISGIPDTFIPRLFLEATVLNLAAILLGAVGLRTLIPQFTTAAALALATGFLVTLMLPADVNPWWNGYAPALEPPTSGWYTIGILAVVLTVLAVRRSYIWVTWPKLWRQGEAS